MNTTRKPTNRQETHRAARCIANRKWGAFAAAGFAAMVFALPVVPAHAAENYQASLKAGDDLRASKQYEQALVEYEAAGKHATTPTEQALALGKKGMIYAFDQKNYQAAREAADAATGMPDIRPVALVTALQVMAECQMKEDKDYAGATATLERALELEGVAWAQPTLTMALGDSYRFSGKFPLAIETYNKTSELPETNPGMKGIAFLNIGLTQQYNLHDAEEAKKAYKKAVELNPALQKEVDGHLARIP